MGFRFRKSINLGGGVRINLSKSGVGYSWGVPGFRVTKTAKGATRTTASIPGTGVSYVTETGGNKVASDGSASRPTGPISFVDVALAATFFWALFWPPMFLVAGPLGVVALLRRFKGAGGDSNEIDGER